MEIFGQTRACAVCGAAFIPKRSNGVCCSDPCRYRRSYQQSRDYSARVAASYKEAKRKAEEAAQATLRAEEALQVDLVAP